MLVKEKIGTEIILDVLNATTTGKGGMFTVKSTKTGKEYTYKINKSLYKSKWYAHVFVETGYLDFLYLGYYSNGQLIKKGEVCVFPSAIAIAYIFSCLEKGFITYINERTEVFHLGRCVKCNRPLTDSNSIKTGLGPYCRSIV